MDVLTFNGANSVRVVGKAISIPRLLEDFPTYGRTGSQRELRLNSQRPHFYSVTTLELPWISNLPITDVNNHIFLG